MVLFKIFALFLQKSYIEWDRAQPTTNTHTDTQKKKMEPGKGKKQLYKEQKGIDKIEFV